MAELKPRMIVDGEVVKRELLPPVVPDAVYFTLTCNSCRYTQDVHPRVLHEAEGLLRCPGCGTLSQIPSNLLHALPMIRDLAGKGQLETFMKEHGHEYGWLRPLLGMGDR